MVTFIALAAPQEAAIVEHILGLRVQTPVAALAWIARLARQLDETIVERQVVANAVLPERILVAIIRKTRANKIANARQCGPSIF